MKNVRSKFLIKIVASLWIVISLLGIVFNDRVLAAGTDDDEVFGSVLLTPITKLLTGLGDGIMDLIHSTVLEQDETIIRLDGEADSWWEQHGESVLGWMMGIAIFFIIAFVTLGAGTPIFAGVGIAAKLGGVAFVVKTITSAAVIGTASGIGVTAIARVVDSAYLANDIYLPVFNLTPEEIFSDKIWLFDVNFFETADDKNYTLQKDTDIITVHASDQNGMKYGTIVTEASKIEGNANNGVITIAEAQNIPIFATMIQEVNAKLASGNSTQIQDSIHKFKVNRIKSSSQNALVNELTGQIMPGTGYTDILVEIFIIYSEDTSNNSEYLIIKFESHTDHAGSSGYEKLTMQLTEKNKEEKTSIATELRGVVSDWYFTLRNLALLILMLLLIYSGIRIVIGSTAGEKAKYKERIMDWVVSICLIFAMHYLMVFAVELNEKFVELVESTNGIKGVVKIIQLNSTNHLNVATKDARLNDFIRDGEADYDEPELAGVKFLEWPTNIMGGVRIEQQLVNEGTANWIGYALCYLVLVGYTVFFTWTYLRRVLYMAFLTIIAPLVAMTYSLDKITDGKAQAFNSWLREYIFNLLIQPFHLILYTVLVTAAYELAGKNALYALVSVGFMMPAEKLLRKFFGFEKAQTPGALGGATGAALAMSGLQKLISFGNKDANPPQEESKKDNDIKFSKADGIDQKAIVKRQADGVEGFSISSEEEDLGSGLTNALPKMKNLTIKGKDENKQEEVELPGLTETNVNVMDNKNGQNVLNVKRGAGENTEADVLEMKSRAASKVREGVSGNNGTNEKEAVAISGGNTRKTGNIEKEELKLPSNRNRGGFWKAVGAGISSYSRLQGQKHYKRVKKSKPIRSLARGVAGLATGTFLGMAGLALGIASGDPSKALQYTSAGAVGGWGIGKGVVGRVANTFSVDKNKMKDAWELSYYGSDYKKAKLKQQKKEFAHDEDNISYLIKTLGVSRNDAKEILETTGAECLDNGIDQIEDVAAIYSFTEEQSKLNRINMQNVELEGFVQAYEDANWDSKHIENGKEVQDFLPEEDAKQIEADLTKEFEEEQKQLDAETKAEIVRLDGVEKEIEEKLEKETEAKIKADKEKIEAEARKLVERDINDFEAMVGSEIYNRTRSDLDEINKIQIQLLNTSDEVEEKKLLENLAKRQENISNITATVRAEIDESKRERLEEEIRNIQKSEAKKFREQRGEELRKKYNKLQEDKGKELEKKRKELEDKKNEKRNEKKEEIKRANARAHYMASNEYQARREVGIAEIKKSIASKDENFQKAYKNASEFAMAMKKYSSRTSDLSKAGAKKLNSYIQQFSSEFYRQYLEEEKKNIEKYKNEEIAKGVKPSEAEKNAMKRVESTAQARATKTAEFAVKGIKMFDESKASLTEAKNIK